MSIIKDEYYNILLVQAREHDDGMIHPLKLNNNRRIIHPINTET